LSQCGIVLSFLQGGVLLSFRFLQSNAFQLLIAQEGARQSRSVAQTKAIQQQARACYFGVLVLQTKSKKDWSQRTRMSSAQQHSRDSDFAAAQSAPR